ncbi:hypothetical protein H0H81_012754 [Sphagnurus paluster]|uniref:Amidohydrolase 3 domain-containing protein n=1 Tax=Sphagnurus paluster TaxID=117069 RepID=A0A9P7FUK7_9AGAR|nr:hypothetical protein H0H81_012754 [Sphagnurus paluster]
MSSQSLRNRSKENLAQRDESQQASSSLPPTPPTSFSPKLRLGLFGIALASAVFLYARPAASPAYALCAQGNRKAIYTVDSSNSEVQCMVVRGARIVDTGDLEDVQARWEGPRLDVKYIGKDEVVIPGMSDTLELLADYVKSDPVLSKDKTKVVEGWGYDHASWDVPVYPTAADLDSHPVLRGRQIMLSGRDGHTLWVSKASLAANGPFPADKDVEGGIIFRDDKGEPTGIFLDKAMELIKPPALTFEDRAARFRTTVSHALQHGLTSLHDAGAGPDSIPHFISEAERGALPIRIYGMRWFDPEEHAPYWGNTTSKILSTLKGDEAGTRLTSRSVKIFADGALRSGGAALYDAYSDNPHTHGVMRISPEHVKHVVPMFLRDGWQVNIHAIGDRANGIILDTFEQAQRELGVNIRALRPRLEHAQIMAPEDMHRIGDLGVIASIQPTHATSDMWFGEERLGPERVKGLYAFRSIVAGGSRITLGSDFPVEGVNPLDGFFAAITRTTQDGRSPHGPGGWFPEQKLSRLEALRGMTIDPAFASFTEKYLGSLEPGKRADFVILSKDIMKVSPQDILKTKVRATVIDGKVAYGMI